MPRSHEFLLPDERQRLALREVWEDIRAIQAEKNSFVGDVSVDGSLAVKGPRPWIDVTRYGADPTGAKDSLPAFKAAYADLPKTGGVIYVPAGDYRMTDTWAIGDGSSSQVSTKQNVSVVGAGAGPAQAPFNEGISGATRLRWHGASGGVMVQVNGPIRVTMSDFVLYGRGAGNYAGTGLKLVNVSESSFARIKVFRVAGPGLYITSTATIPTNASGSLDNYFEQIVVGANDASGGYGMLLGEALASQSVGVSRMQFMTCVFLPNQASGVHGIRFRFTDQNYFYGCFIWMPGGVANSYPLSFEGVSDNATFPKNNHFVSCNFFNGTGGQIANATGRTTGIGYPPAAWFLDWSLGDGQASTNQPDNFFGFEETGRWFGDIVRGIPFQWVMRSGALSTTATEYFVPSGTHLLDTVEANNQIVVDAPLRVFSWRVALDAAPGAGASRTFTLRKNGVATAAAITISGTNTSGTWTGAVDVAAGDLLSIQSTLTGTPAAARARSTMRVREI